MQGKEARAARLLELAREEFGKLTKAEEKFFEAVAKGELADYSAKGKGKNDPAKANEWGRGRVLKADRIEWVCTEPEACKLVRRQGIRVRGARVSGELDLEYARIPFVLDFEKCAFPGGIDLSYADVRGLHLEGTHTGALLADRVKVEGYVLLRRGFRANGEVCLLGAEIGAQLNCSKGEFANSEGDALKGDGMRVGGTVFLSEGFKAEGDVRLAGAEIGTNLECESGEFVNPDGEALNGDGMKVGGDVYLCGGFKARGEVRLVGAVVRGDVNCGGGKFANKGEIALNAEKVKVGGDVFLREGFRAEGEVRLLGADIGGQLDCKKGELVNPEGRSLNGDGMKVAGGVFLSEGFEAKGEVRLLGTAIGCSLECDGGKFVNKGAEALVAERLRVEGSIFLREDFRAEGGVRLLGAAVGGCLECDGGKFVNKGEVALDGDGLKVGGDVFLRKGFEAEGEVRLLGAVIGRSLDCTEGKFTNKGDVALSADGLRVGGDVFLWKGFEAEGRVVLAGASIGGCFTWTDVASPESVRLDLRSARVGTLRDDEESWPAGGKLFLHGLVYDEIDDEAPKDAESRIKWLRRQPSDRFTTQPYEQLAAVLRRSGQEEDAREILIAREKDRGRFGQMGRLRKLGHGLLGCLIGYGYRPWRAFWFMLAILLLGWFLFAAGFRSAVITPTKKEAYVLMDGEGGREVSEHYPKFNAVMYSVDMFVPLVDLHQASYWLPNANRGSRLNLKVCSVSTGSLLRSYLWFHIVSGWALTTLLVVGLTGLIRR